MKKIFIIGAALSLVTFGVHAQEINQSRTADKARRTVYEKAPKIDFAARHNNNNKTTGPGGSRVMSAVDDLFLAGSSLTGYYGLIFNDSTGYLVYSNGVAEAWWNYGHEQIYAPFAANANDESVWTDNIIDLSLEKQNNITVDTIKIYGLYVRNDNSTTDSLIVNFSTDISDFTRYQTWSPTIQTNYNVDTLTFRTMDVDTITNEAILSSGTRYAIPLNAATLADTTANGYNVFSIPVFQNTTNATLFGAAVSFKYTGSWALGDTITENLNYWRPIFYEEIADSRPTYKKGITFTTNGVLTMDNKYGSWFSSDGTTVEKYLPIWYYGPTFRYEYPLIEYVVSCADCDILSLKDNEEIAFGKAYPNPATDMLNIPVVFKNASDVTVSITNVLGQEVSRTSLGRMSGSQEAHVSTSHLQDGMYFATFITDGTNAGTIKFTVK